MDENAIVKKVRDLRLNGDKWVRRGINAASLFYLLILEAAGGRNSGLASSSLRQEDWEPSRHTSLGNIQKLLENIQKLLENVRNC